MGVSFSAINTLQKHAIYGILIERVSAVKYEAEPMRDAWHWSTLAMED